MAIGEGALVSAQEVRLTHAETFQAAFVGVLRQLEALKRHLPDRHGFNGEDSWTVHIEGAGGELAVAKLLGCYWGASVNTFRLGGDVGRLQVRTRSRHEYELLVRPSDRAEDLYIHVTGRLPVFLVHGWVAGHEAQQPCYLHDYGGRPPAYFVPFDHLRSLASLPLDDDEAAGP